MADYKLVEGYDNAIDLICRMRKCESTDIYKCENIIRHSDIYGERHYWYGPDNSYHEIVILFMKDSDGYFHCNMDKLKEKAREDVKIGRFTVQPRR